MCARFPTAEQASGDCVRFLLGERGMRLLVLYQAEDPAQGHPGYYEGFERMVAEGRLEAHAALGYLGVAGKYGWPALWDDACRIAKERNVNAIFLNWFHEPMPDPHKGLLRLVSLPNRPIVFSSLGDPYGRWTHRVPRAFRVASRMSDLTFLTGMGYIAHQLAQGGSRNLVLMPNGCCQVRFSSSGSDIAEEPEFDVCFVGNRMRSINPANHFFWVARKRNRFVKAFTKRYGKRFACLERAGKGTRHGRGPRYMQSR
jgi:hypothetical protein